MVQLGATGRAHEVKRAGVKGAEPGAVSDAQHGGPAQLLVKDRHHPALIDLVQSRGGLIEKNPGRAMQQQARKSDQLLLTERKTLDERSEEHTSELQSPDHLVCRLLLDK